MRKRILLVTLLVSVVGVLFLSILFSAVFYGQTVERTFSELKIYMNVYEAGYASLPPDEEQAQALSEELGGARVTFLSETGEVLADTGGAEDNHVTREEVQQALLTGEGKSVRTSATLRESMLYYCRAFEQGDTLLLVRLAVPARSGLAIFAESLPTVVWFLVVDILCCLFVAWLATSFVLRPVEQLTQEAALSGGKEVRTKYAELAPIAKMINLMNADLHEKVEKMNEDRRLEKLILNSIEHGIVIFRDPSDVILINRTAKRLLDYEVNEPVPCFVNDREIVAVLEAGENAALVRKINGRYYSFRFTFNEKSRVLLITDVTETTAAAISKNDFIANVTHEMNTPLTSIRGFAELLASGALEGERAQKASATILAQSERLQNLVASIINYSEIDSEDLPLYEVDASRIARETLAALSPEIAERRLVLLSEIRDGVMLMSRHERVTEIFGNIIRNAIRYNREGGSISVLLTEEEFSVSDTGIGIAEENLDRIFDRFFTVDKSHNGKNGGFGLGLSVVKKLCKKQGWKLTVESKEGAGSTFRIAFAQEAAPEPQK